jgi:threonine/homoserine/homoserine lactone efflux protein
MDFIWLEFFKVALAHLLAVASPGPDFAIVLRQSLRHGRRTAIWTSVGVGMAITLHVTYSLLGLGLILKSSAVAFDIVKYSGAAYLAWLGWQALRSPSSPAVSDPAVADISVQESRAPSRPPGRLGSPVFSPTRSTPRRRFFSSPSL